MQAARIASLLAPFLPASALTDAQLEQVSIYLDLLLRWNAKTNLTAVRAPEEIITRHFGESFFLARHVFSDEPPREPSLPERGFPITQLPNSPISASSEPILNEQMSKSANEQIAQTISQSHNPDEPMIRCTDEPIFNEQMSKSANEQMVVDLGSGAGFPGIPIKIYAPRARVTLIESQNKKATFLKEVIRALTLTTINVFSGRAEDYIEAHTATNARIAQTPSGSASVLPAAADIVTLRAVEHFDHALPLAARLLQSPPALPTNATPPRLALLIGSSQLRVKDLLPDFQWQAPLPVPLSDARLLLIGSPLNREPSY